MDAFEKLVEKHFPEQKSLQALMEMVQEQFMIMSKTMEVFNLEALINT